MTTEHVSVPSDEIEALIKQWKQECMAFADMPNGIPVPKRLYLWNRVADLEAILSRATPSDEVGAIGELKKLLHTMCQYKWESDKYQGRYVVHSFAADLGTILSRIGKGESIFELISAAKYSLVIDQSEETVSLKFGGHTHNSSGIEILLEFDKTSAPRVVTAELSNTIAGDIAEHLRDKGWSSGGDYQDDFLPDVEIATRAALESFATSLPAARVPDGWKLVPVEPTEEMIMAASNAAHDVPTHKRWMPAAWHAALAAAPQAGQNDEIAR